jgi:hypothetical protein
VKPDEFVNFPIANAFNRPYITYLSENIVFSWPRAEIQNWSVPKSLQTFIEAF